MAMFGCLFVYATLVEFLRMGPNAPRSKPGSQMDLIRMILFAVAVLSVATSFMMKKLILAGLVGFAPKASTGTPGQRLPTPTISFICV